jgi:multidrug resistance efflux pump
MTAIPAHTPALGPERLRFTGRFLVALVAGAAALTLLAGWLSWRLGMELSVEAEGFLEPQQRHLIKTSQGGLLRQLAVRQGQKVEAGALLAALEDREWQAELLKTDKDLEIARTRRREVEERLDQERKLGQAEVGRAQLALDRAQLQLEQALIEERLDAEAVLGLASRPPAERWSVRYARAELAQRQFERSLARQRLEGLEVGRRELEALDRTGEKLLQDRALLTRRLEQTLIRAPVAGTVLTEGLERRPGDYLQAGESLLELAQDSRWQARVLVREEELPKVHPGQQVRLYLRAFPHLEHRIFPGQVHSVAALPAPQGSGYEVKIWLGPQEYPLACGMSARALILVERGRIASLLWRRLLQQLGQRPGPGFYVQGSGG